MNLAKRKRDALLLLGKLSVLCGRRELITQAALSHLEALKWLADITLKDVTTEEMGSIMKWAQIHHSVHILRALCATLLADCSIIFCSAGSRSPRSHFWHPQTAQVCHLQARPIWTPLHRISGASTGLSALRPPSNGSISM